MGQFRALAPMPVRDASTRRPRSTTATTLFGAY